MPRQCDRNGRPGDPGGRSEAWGRGGAQSAPRCGCQRPTRAGDRRAGDRRQGRNRGLPASDRRRHRPQPVLRLMLLAGRAGWSGTACTPTRPRRALRRLRVRAGVLGARASGCWWTAEAVVGAARTPKRNDAGRRGECCADSERMDHLDDDDLVADGRCSWLMPSLPRHRTALLEMMREAERLRVATRHSSAREASVKRVLGKGGVRATQSSDAVIPARRPHLPDQAPVRTGVQATGAGGARQALVVPDPRPRVSER